MVGRGDCPARVWSAARVRAGSQGRKQTLLKQQLCGRDQLLVRMREEVGHSA